MSLVDKVDAKLTDLPNQTVDAIVAAQARIAVVARLAEAKEHAYNLCAALLDPSKIKLPSEVPEFKACYKDLSGELRSITRDTTDFDTTHTDRCRNAAREAQFFKSTIAELTQFMNSETKTVQSNLAERVHQRLVSAFVPQPESEVSGTYHQYHLHQALLDAQGGKAFAVKESVPALRLYYNARTSTANHTLSYVEFDGYRVTRNKEDNTFITAQIQPQSDSA